MVQNSGDPWARIEAAVARLDRLTAGDNMRRTAADTAALAAEVERLKQENDELRQQLEAAEARNLATRRRASQMAGQVDRALDQLDLAMKA